jgi:hypothetical protein
MHEVLPPACLKRLEAGRGNVRILDMQSGVLENPTARDLEANHTILEAVLRSMPQGPVGPLAANSVFFFADVCLALDDLLQGRLFSGTREQRKLLAITEGAKLKRCLSYLRRLKRNNLGARNDTIEQLKALTPDKLPASRLRVRSKTRPAHEGVGAGERGDKAAEDDWVEDPAGGQTGGDCEAERDAQGEQGTYCWAMDSAEGEAGMDDWAMDGAGGETGGDFEAEGDLRQGNNCWATDSAEGEAGSDHCAQHGTDHQPGGDDWAEDWAGREADANFEAERDIWAKGSAEGEAGSDHWAEHGADWQPAPEERAEDGAGGKKGSDLEAGCDIQSEHGTYCWATDSAEGEAPGDHWAEHGADHQPGADDWVEPVADGTDSEAAAHLSHEEGKDPSAMGAEGGNYWAFEDGHDEWDKLLPDEGGEGGQEAHVGARGHTTGTGTNVCPGQGHPTAHPAPPLPTGPSAEEIQEVRTAVKRQQAEAASARRVALTSQRAGAVPPKGPGHTKVRHTARGGQAAGGQRPAAPLSQWRTYDLEALGVPLQARPCSEGRGAHSYTLTSANRARVQVLVRERAYFVKRPQGGNQHVQWHKHGGPAQAWAVATAAAGW